MTEQQKGMVFAFLSYAIWGIFPMFWKLLQHVDSMELLAGRIIWSFVFTTIFVLIIGQLKYLRQDLLFLWRNKKQFFSLIAASFFISINWFTYIWAVTHDHVLESSMGYYINPLISVLFGMLFFKEKLSRATILSVIMASLGVLIIAVNYGQVPWTSLLLALSFGIYGVLKKKIELDATRGLAIETLFILPFALIYMLYLYGKGTVAFLHIDITTDVLILVSGILTAIPLVLFAKGAQKIPLYLMGFIQYVSPSITFVLGVFLYKEPFSNIDLLAFSCIWIALLIFSLSKLIEARKRNAIKTA
ncbi:EamA family transporter RarD [Lysinibacillus sp. 54212]|uniref:EamA family transporter RarD n=1 Tax=Lysinibacillus sp. 54212 TaxID=3119829 RepID=UPI002FC83A43